MSYFRSCAAILLVTGLLSACEQQPSSSTATTTTTTQGETMLAKQAADGHYSHKLIDKFASRETLALYNNLAGLRGAQMLFGHQDSLAYGVNWEGDLDRSDIRDVTGSNPALYGWELGGLELGHAANLDGVNFQQMQEWIKAGYSRGGVITLSWHMNNPSSGGNSWDKTPSVHELTPGGAKHDLFKTYLDTFVAFNKGLVATDATGKTHQIPIIFRPWHEHNGDWFWWGKGNVSEQDYIALWQFTVKYLRDEKDLHNLIFAYSPDRSRIDLAQFESGYFYAYPGDEYVDVIGLDNYWDVGHEANIASAEEQKAAFVTALKGIVNIAQVRNKIAALTETGNNRLTIPNFWTERILNPILNGAEARQITYMMVWRNANKAREQADQFFAPYPGQATAEDFKAFFENPYVLFENTLPRLYQ
jgi:mannan endo-1,4-beta-mannosidase